MKVLIAIKSCERDLKNGCHVAIRETWGKDAIRMPGVDLRFFIGDSRHPLLPDEVRVQGRDDLVSLPGKVREMAKWSVENGYDFTFFCDVDTFVKPARLLACGFQSADYTGRFGDVLAGNQLHDFIDGRLGKITVWAYASGGVGYFLSRRAAELVANMPLVHYAEDVCVGAALGPLIRDRKLTCLNPPMFDGHVAWHYCTWGKTQYVWPHSVGFNPEWMRESYKRGQPW